MLMCPRCQKAMSKKEWRRRRLHAGGLECPKCYTKLHDRELKKV